MLFYFSDISFLALFFVKLKRNNIVGLPFTANLVKEHRSAQAIRAKADRVVFVVCHKLRAAVGAGINICVIKGRFFFCVIARIIGDFVDRKKLITIVTGHFLFVDIKPQTRSASRTMDHMCSAFLL